jgi:DUF1680 family protein
MHSTVARPSLVEGPVAPTSEAASALRPLAHDAMRLSGDGWLGGWQDRSREVTIPHVLAQVTSGEALTNLRRVLDPGVGPYSGMTFTDTDVYKTLEGLAWGGGPDHLLAEAQWIVDLLAEVQEPDGYLNSRVQGSPEVDRWSDPQAGHELYSAGHLLQAAVAATRTGVLPGLQEVGLRFADLLVQTFAPGSPVYVEGHPLVEMALVELFRVTGRREYLELAARQLDDRGHGWLGQGPFGSAYFQDAEPLREANEAVGHAVRQLYLMAGAVDIAVETDDASLLQAVQRLWDDLYTGKTYLTGVHGSRHRDEAIGDRYELPPDRAYAETCAAIAAFQLNWRLLLATGEARYAEAMEVSLYNAIPASTSERGDEFFYANPLQLRPDHHGAGDLRSGRQPWFGCACCPPNLVRLLASVHDYLATASDAGLQLHQIAAGTLTAPVYGLPATLDVVTDFPYQGRVAVVIEYEGDGEWELSVRLPAWATDVSATLDGAPLAVDAADGYLRVRRDWSGRHELVLALSVHPQLVHADHRVDAVRGCAAVTCGPFVYALEQVDLPPGLLLEDVVLISLAGEPEHEERDASPRRVRVTAAARTGSPPGLYATHHEAAMTPPFLVSLIPYYSWGNRGADAMRVWIPLAPEHQDAH